MGNKFLRISGSYTDWNIYRKSVIISDVTEMFIRRAIDPHSRTHDQMRQAARSCKQNIVEGACDSTISVEMCIIARGSARELREDYGDFLRQQGFDVWDKDDQRTINTRNYCKQIDDSKIFVEKCRERSDETVANIMITQLCQMDALLAELLKRLEADFLINGGIKETMSAARRNNRGY